MEKRKDPIYQAQDILSRRDHSAHEVKVKLRRKGFTNQQVTEAIAWLQEQKLLDDARFAQALVADILRFKAVGPRYMRLKLKQRGIAEAVASQAVQAAFPPGREKELIFEATQQWRRAHPRQAEDNHRLYRFLASRGFSPDKITISPEAF